MTSSRSYLKIILIGLFCGAVVALGAGLLQTQHTVFPENPSGLLAVRNYADPARLKIPAIGVDASVVSAGLKPDGTMDTPHDQYSVAWYKYGPRPGLPGNAVMAGHLDTKLTPTAVFYNLNKLKPG